MRDEVFYKDNRRRWFILITAVVLFVEISLLLVGFFYSTHVALLVLFLFACVIITGIILTAIYHILYYH